VRGISNSPSAADVTLVALVAGLSKRVDHEAVLEQA
jgi:hypothetical protein